MADRIQGPTSANQARSATHDISRTSFHIKHIGQFARRVEESAARAFPNRGRSSQRYSKVQSLLLHWGTDDLFVLPELEDLEKCFREDYAFGTDIWAIPSENSHLELMMRLGQLIKEHESPDTLFLIYYGGHARIDDSRQSTWCATRETDSPWLQWSAIQTLLERSRSDVLILLDCCAGAASATFPTGNSITETISASSWDAIAPDPGRYSFTNALIEVMQEWRHRAFSAAMLHAEVLARLKHPRPITINGKHFEARSTPVHFMMTSNHKAPSIELSRIDQDAKITSSPGSAAHINLPAVPSSRDASIVMNDSSVSEVPQEGAMSEPNEDTPHVMISLALEEDQRLDINAWEQWLGAFPAMAKYVKIQGVFKSHSTLLLVSMPVTVWDLLPEDHATSFVAFIRSNNLAAERAVPPVATLAVPVRNAQHELTDSDAASFYSRVSGTTFVPTEATGMTQRVRDNALFHGASAGGPHSSQPAHGQYSATISSSPFSHNQNQVRTIPSVPSLNTLRRYPSSTSGNSEPVISQRMIINQQQHQRRTTFGTDVPEPKKFAAHVERRLEDYYQHEQLPNDAQKAFFASNLGVEPWHVEAWFHHRRERDAVSNRLAAMRLNDTGSSGQNGPRMLLPADLDRLLRISAPGQTILFDLRSPQEYQRSHIHNAISLRAPRSFLQVAPLEMLDRAISDEEGRQRFGRWRNAQYLVFYARNLEQPSECLAAELLFEKLQESAWFGRCFILKGHYREFSDSYGQYIVGNKMTAEARAWSEMQDNKATQTIQMPEHQRLFDQWLTDVEREDRTQPQASSPTRMSERARMLDAQERDLESEFHAQHPDLYDKAREVSGANTRRSSDYNLKAQLVEHMDRGLTKMREAQAHASASVSPPAPVYEPGHSKLADDSYLRRDREDRNIGGEYVEVDKAAEETPIPGTPRGRPREVGEGRGGILHKVFRRS